MTSALIFCIRCSCLGNNSSTPPVVIMPLNWPARIWREREQKRGEERRGAERSGLGRHRSVWLAAHGLWRGCRYAFGPNCKHRKASEFHAWGLKTVRSTKRGERMPSDEWILYTPYTNSPLISFPKNGVKIYPPTAKKKSCCLFYHLATSCRINLTNFLGITLACHGLFPPFKTKGVSWHQIWLLREKMVFVLTYYYFPGCVCFVFLEALMKAQICTVLGSGHKPSS